jgi:hypothetical protein
MTVTGIIVALSNVVDVRRVCIWLVVGWLALSLAVVNTWGAPCTTAVLQTEDLCYEHGWPFAYMRRAAAIHNDVGWEFFGPLPTELLGGNLHAVDRSSSRAAIGDVIAAVLLVLTSVHALPAAVPGTKRNRTGAPTIAVFLAAFTASLSLGFSVPPIGLLALLFSLAIGLLSSFWSAFRVCRWIALRATRRGSSSKLV